MSLHVHGLIIDLDQGVNNTLNKHQKYVIVKQKYIHILYKFYIEIKQQKKKKIQRKKERKDNNNYTFENISVKNPAFPYFSI